jgi:hypothetical protein
MKARTKTPLTAAYLVHRSLAPRGHAKPICSFD